MYIDTGLVESEEQAGDANECPNTQRGLRGNDHSGGGGARTGARAGAGAGRGARSRAGRGTGDTANDSGAGDGGGGGVGDAGSARNGVIAGSDLHDVGGSGFEIGRREGDGVAVEVVDDVGAADEGVAEGVGGANDIFRRLGDDAEGAVEDFAGGGLGAAVAGQDHFADGYADDLAGEDEFDGGGCVCQRAFAEPLVGLFGELHTERLV